MQHYWVIFLLVISVKASDLIGMFNTKQKCEKITSYICKSNIRTVGYNTTRFPNFLNHRAQYEAELELKQYQALVKMECSPHLAQFLCALYIPVCMEKYDGLIPPCQELCLKSKNGCSMILQKFGFSWPQVLDCDNFPKQSNKSSLCIGISEENLVTASGTSNAKSDWNTAKENEFINLKCSKGKVIEIRKIRHSKTSSCCTKASHGVISAMCDGKRNCKFIVSSATLGGHCNNLVGELSIRYKCVSQSKTKACE